MAVVSDPPRRDEVWLVVLNPTLGSEMQKTRPCLVLSPDEMNRYLKTIIIAPMTTTGRPYPMRVTVAFEGKQGQVALDQIRAVDRQRLIRKLGIVPPQTAETVSDVLIEMFARPKAPAR